MGDSQPKKDNDVVRYLLGTLPESERERLEDDYLSDDDRGLFDELTTVEAELIDDRARGELDEANRARFEERYLRGPAGKERLAFARWLTARGSRHLQSHAASAPGRPWLWPAMGRRRPLLASALASAILVIAVLIVWRGNRPATSPAPGQARTGGVATTPGTATPQPPTTEPAPHVSARPSSAPETFALSLVPGLARAPGRPATLEIAPGATTIRIRLDLDGAGYASYRAALATADGEEVWRREGLTALQPGGMAVGITLPAAILPPGDYVVRLSGATPPDAFEEIAFYAFRVVGR